MSLAGRGGRWAAEGTQPVPRASGCASHGFARPQLWALHVSGGQRHTVWPGSRASALLLTRASLLVGESVPELVSRLGPRVWVPRGAQHRSACLVCSGETGSRPSRLFHHIPAVLPRMPWEFFLLCVSLVPWRALLRKGSEVGCSLHVCENCSKCFFSLVNNREKNHRRRKH